MRTLTVTTKNYNTGDVKDLIFHNVKGFLDAFAIKNLYRQGLKVMNERIEFK